MSSRSLTLHEVRSRLKSFEEPIVNGIINRYHLKKSNLVHETKPVLDYEANQIHAETKIRVDLDAEIVDCYLHQILPLITGESENTFYVQDQLLLDLISCRVYYGKEIAEIKFRDNTAIFLEHCRNKYPLMPLIDNPAVEYSILKRAKTYEKLTHGADLSQPVEKIFAEMIRLNKELQVQYIQTRIQQLRVGYLGPEGTFASQISRHYFKGLPHLEPKESHQELFEKLDDQQLDMIVVPARNNLTGLIPGVDLDEERHYLVKMIDFKVVIDLLGKTELSWDQVEKIYSHPQAYAEAHEWVQEYLPKAVFVPSSSTAAASKHLLEDTGKCVALSSRRCAEKLGLQVLQEEVVKNSVTTFFIVARR